MNNATSHVAAEGTQAAGMTYEKWIEIYKPIKNHFNELAPLDGTMFETFDRELQHVRAANEDRVWTLVEGEDDEWILTNGFHYVNRIGYVITEVPFVAQPDMPALDIIVDNGENPGFPKSAWQDEVAKGLTKMGYQDWVFHQEECAAHGIPAGSVHDVQLANAGGAA